MQANSYLTYNLWVEESIPPLLVDEENEQTMKKTIKREYGL